MMKLTNVAHWTVRLTGPAQVVLGLLFWSGQGLTLLPLHMLIGVVFVFAVLVLAGTAAWAGLRMVPVLLSVTLGLVIPVLGVTQARLLPGPAHWLVRLAHLLLGIVAMGVAARLARFTRSRSSEAPLRVRERPVVGGGPPAGRRRLG